MDKTPERKPPTIRLKVPWHPVYKNNMTVRKYIQQGGTYERLLRDLKAGVVDIVIH